ncbi:hypothetical protein QYE76_045756 [Lolium multiflorum]|uniref:Uncharacterized protein n=1 Tax=Lolium multiflorum TaxID=4521 RepID=A0AAD8TNL8_LOLMU|nr:hypothetical protein QYE76_045756 [Lolium multiflorum]
MVPEGTTPPLGTGQPQAAPRHGVGAPELLSDPMSSRGSSSEDYKLRRKHELLRDLDKGTFTGWMEEGPIPPNPDLSSFPAVEEAFRVTDEFCNKYRALRMEVEILQEENNRLRRMLENFLTPIKDASPPLKE